MIDQLSQYRLPVDAVINLDGEYINLNTPDHFGRALRALNMHFLHVENHSASPKTEGHVARACLGMLARWANEETTHDDRRRLAFWVQKYNL